MRPVVRVLFVMFKDVDAVQSSGSSVRPAKMLQAFRAVGCDVVLLDGAQNDLKERRKRVRRVVRRIKEGERFDLCYIEPPSGPLFCPTDLSLLKLLKTRGIPTGLFYRDAYHLFPDSHAKKSAIKEFVISKMAQRDFKIIERSCKTVYVPTLSFGRIVGFSRIKALPPGCRPCPSSQAALSNDGATVSALYVGGISKDYGIDLLLDSFKAINLETLRVKLTVVCPRGAWDCYVSSSDLRSQLPAWLTVVHASGADLDSHYASADFGIIPRLRSSYNDICFPVKLVEYLSHGLPVVATNCTETASFVRRWEVGIIAEDDTESLSSAIASLLTKGNIRKYFERKIETACEENSWKSRVMTVLTDLNPEKAKLLESSISNNAEVGKLDKWGKS